MQLPVTFLLYSWYDQGTIQQKKCYSWLACNNFVPSRYLLKILGQYIHSYALMLMCSVLFQIPKSRAGPPKSQKIADWRRCWIKCLTSRWLKSTISWISRENFCVYVLTQGRRSITLSAGQLYERWEYNVLDHMYNFKRDTDAMTSFFFFIFFLNLSCLDLPISSLTTAKDYVTIKCWDLKNPFCLTMRLYILSELILYTNCLRKKKIEH